ncbi:hypothetical protein AAK894_14250 [Lachnospiraceae bacterium 46-61]
MQMIEVKKYDLEKNGKMMTEKQRKLLFVLARQKGMDNELLHSYMEVFKYG